MVNTVTANEVTDFRSAVAGVEIDYVRTDEGFGPATMVSEGDDDVAVSSGGLEFSALLHTEVPDDRLVLQVTTRAPAGLSWNGSEARELELRLYGPATSVFGNVPAGSSAITTVVRVESLTAVEGHLGHGSWNHRATAGALPRTPAVGALVHRLAAIEACPGSLATPANTSKLLEDVSRAFASIDVARREPGTRGFDSREIVAVCLEHVRSTGVHQPTISELCRVALASESRLRQAFVEILGTPPIQYFQLRVLSILRDDLAAADPERSTVTQAALSLGLTQLGRVAGRYRALFGETPRQTLQRHEARHL